MTKQTITSDDILGKDAIDPDGEVLGVITKLHIDKSDKKIVGITIDMGFMKPDLFIGLNYIKNFGVDSVFISKIPTTKYVGMEVIDSKAKFIGKVKKVITKRNKVEAIIVKEGLIHISDIDEISVKIILKPNYKIKDI